MMAEPQFHIFTCSACSRQWTVWVRQPNDTQCYFRGLCFDCINAHGVTAEAIDAALRPLFDAEAA